MRIVHVITRLLQGGAEENTIATCLHQARNGADVVLVHGCEHHTEWARRLAGQVRLVELPSLAQSLNPLRDLKATRELRGLFRQLQPEVVHTHQSKAGVIGRMAAAWAGVPLIVHTIHIAPFVNVTGARRRFYIAAESLCARFTDVLIAVSHGMRDAFLEAGIGARTGIEVIHSGMALDRFTSAAGPVAWRSRIGGWDGPEKPRMLLMLAAFEPRKRQRELLHAIAPALRSRPDVLLLLGGEGSQKAACEAAAQTLGIAPQVRFLGHDPNPHELIALSDICLLTSEREGLPRSVVQYVAGGKAVVMSGLPGIEELVADGVNGIVTGADDLAELVSATFALLDDDDQLARLCAGARATDVSRWREEAMGEAIAAAYARARSSKDGRVAPIRAVEFFGLPGSGKTTVARALIAQLRDQGYEVSFGGETMGDHLPMWRRSLRRFGLICGELAWRPAVLVRSAAHLGSASSELKDRAKTVWNYCSVLAMSRRHSRLRQDVLVLDQGLVQALWTGEMHREQSDPPLGAATIGADWIESCLFVHVRSSPRTARSRLQRRVEKTSRMQRPDRIGDQALWNKAARIDIDLAGQIESELSQRSLEDRLIHLRCDSRATPDELASSIIAHLETVGGRPLSG